MMLALAFSDRAYSATTTTSETSEAEERDRAWGRSNSDASASGGLELDGDERANAHGCTDREDAPPVVGEGVGTQEAEAEVVVRVENPTTSCDAGSRVAEGRGATNEGASRQARDRRGRAALAEAHDAAARSSSGEPAHRSRRGAVGIEVPTSGQAGSAGGDPGFNIDVQAIDVVWDNEVCVPVDDGSLSCAGNNGCHSGHGKVRGKSIRKHLKGPFTNRARCIVLRK